MCATIAQNGTHANGIGMENASLGIVMCEPFVEPSREAMSIVHVGSVIKLPIGQAADTLCHQWVKLHITACVFGMFHPVFLAPQQQQWKNGRFHNEFSFLFRDGQEYTATDA